MERFRRMRLWRRLSDVQPASDVLLISTVVLSILLKELHRIPEDLQPVALGLQPVARPLRVLRREEVAVRVRHQAQHAAGGVADAGDVVLRPFGLTG